MTRSFCLVGLLAVTGCAGSSSAPPTTPTGPAEVAGAPSATSPKYAILVPNMT